MHDTNSTVRLHLVFLNDPDLRGPIPQPHATLERGALLFLRLLVVVLGQYVPRDRLTAKAGGASGSVMVTHEGCSKCYFSGVSCLLSAGYLLTKEGGGGAARPGRR